MAIDKISRFISRLCFEFDGKVTHFYDKTGFILIIYGFISGIMKEKYYLCNEKCLMPGKSRWWWWEKGDFG
jgi:hypothetical protein